MCVVCSGLDLRGERSAAMHLEASFVAASMDGTPPSRAWEFAATAGDPYIDSLLTGTRWSSTDLTYALPGTRAEWGTALPDDRVVNFVPPPEGLVRAVDLVLAGTTEVAGGVTTRFGSVADLTLLRFTPTDEVQSATVRIGLGDFSGASYGFAVPPGTEENGGPDGGRRGGDTWLNTFNGAGADSLPTTPFTWDGTAFGGDDWLTLIHEIGHALGLSHPFEGSAIPGREGPVIPPEANGVEYTVMAYDAVPGGMFFIAEQAGEAPQSWMIRDIQVLQHLYGANYQTLSGNTTYSWDPVTGEMFIDGVGQGAAPINRILLAIWDGGGRDTYDASNYASDLWIDLGPGQGSLLSEEQLAVLVPGTPPIRAEANVWNAFLVDNDPRSLIEDATGGAGADVILGNRAANLLQGGARNDSLTGFDGADTLDGGTGADEMVGGRGNDVYLVDHAGDAILENADGGRDTVRAAVDWTLEARLEDLILLEFPGALAGTGNDLGNRITGNGGANLLSGLGGEDDLFGVGGNDTLLGGTSNDLLDGGSGEDSLAGGSGNDALYGRTDNDHLDGGAGQDILFGQAGADTLLGGGADDVLDGGTGDDRMEGGAGNDNYYVDSVLDVIVELPGQGEDEIFSTLSYTLGGNLENLVLLGGAFSGTGDARANRINGQDLGNLLAGLGGNDTLSGGGGDDTLLGGIGRDQLQGGEGADSLSAGAGGDTLISGAGDDTLNGDAGSDLLRGWLGADSLDGGVGADTLDGDFGNDTLRGGSGDDIFSFGFFADDDDLIVDFSLANDRIQLSDWLENFDAVLAALSENAGSAQVALSEEVSFVLVGISAAQLTESHFLFG